MDLEKLNNSTGRGGYKLDELKQFCKDNNLKVSGNKKELVERLLNINNQVINQGERQIHGFNYENIFCEKTGATKSTNYTGKFDAELNGIPVQIKCIKNNNEICLGDYFRQLEVDRDFILHIAFYNENNNNNKVIIDHFTMYIDPIKWKQEFDFPEKEAMKVELGLITNLKEDDDRFHIFCDKYKKYFDGKLIQLRFKRDHKTQKRIQTAIPFKNIVLLKRTFQLYTLTLKQDLNNSIVNESTKNETEELSEIIEISSRNQDKFYTKDEIAKSICEFINDQKILDKYKYILEPSAGNGVFIKNIKNINKNIEILAYDINPETNETSIVSNETNILKADFLSNETYNDIIKKVGNDYILCIGNPPFGSNNSLAISFFNKIASIPNVFEIILILPNSFGKESIQNRLDSNFTLYSSYDLPKNSFTLDRNDYNVPTCLQWWYRKTRIIDKTIEQCNNFNYVKYGEEFDIEIVRVGGKCGHAYLNIESPKAKYNYYIILNDKTKISYFIEILNKTDLSNYTNKTTGPKSISKKELNPIINNLLC